MANNLTSASRRKKLAQQGKPVNGKTSTEATLASYGNKRQKETATIVARLKAAQAK
jgi:hypothetical protein